MRREEKAILSFCCQVVTTKKFVFSPLGGLGPRSRCCQGCFLLSSLLAFTWIVCCTLLWPFLWAHTCSGVSSFYPNSSSLFRSWSHLIFNVQTGEICILKGAAVHSGLGPPAWIHKGPSAVRGTETHVLVFYDLCPSFLLGNRTKWMPRKQSHVGESEWAL